MIEQIELLLNMSDPITKQHWMRWDKGDCSEIGLCEILLTQLIREHKNKNGQYYNTDYHVIRLRYQDNNQDNNQYIIDNYPDCILLDGFNEAILGICERINLTPVVAYSVEKMLNILITRDGMTYEEALEYYDFNIACAWLGEFTPIYISNYE